jgi:hypothetical protein
MPHSMCNYFNIILHNIQVLILLVLIREPNLRGNRQGPEGVHRIEIESTDFIENLFIWNQGRLLCAPVHVRNKGKGKTITANNFFLITGLYIFIVLGPPTTVNSKLAATILVFLLLLLLNTTTSTTSTTLLLPYHHYNYHYQYHYY